MVDGLGDMIIMVMILVIVVITPSISSKECILPAGQVRVQILALLLYLLSVTIWYGLDDASGATP